MRFALLFLLVCVFILPSGVTLGASAGRDINDDNEEVYQREPSECYETSTTDGHYQGYNYIGISPLSTLIIGPWGEGVYPTNNNVELHFSINNVLWPAENVNFPLRVAPNAPATVSRELGTIHNLTGPGLPVMAGHSLTTWGGARRRDSGIPLITGGSGMNLAPAAISGLNNSPNIGGNFPTTAWIGNPNNNQPNPRFYPMWLLLGGNPDMTGWIRPDFHTMQLGTQDVNINDTRSNVLLTPEHDMRAVVGDFNAQAFLVETEVQSLRAATFAPLQLRWEYYDDAGFTFFDTVNEVAGLPVGFAEFTGENNAVANHAYHIVTQGFVAPNESFNVAIIPDPNLGAGTHIETVRTYQRGHVYGYENGVFSFDWDYSFPLANLPTLANYANTHRTEFTVRFVVHRPATAAVITNPITNTRAGSINVINPYRNISGNPLSYAYTAASPGFTAIPCSTNPTTDHIITFPPPRYTFFDYDPLDPERNAIRRSDGAPLPITPPTGYIVVSAVVDANGYLIVTITPGENGGGTEPNCRPYFTPTFTITKNMTMPTGTFSQDRPFQFEITLAHLWQNAQTVTPTPIFSLPNVPITIPQGATTGTATFNFNDVVWADISPLPGFYTFQVREQFTPGNHVVVGANEIMVYDENVFYVFLQVGWICDDFAELGILAYRTQYWRTVAACLTCPDEAQHAPQWYCDPTHVGCDCSPCYYGCGWRKNANIVFNNNLIRKGPFVVTKTVTGNFANPDDYFRFSVRMILPEMIPYGYRGTAAAPIVGQRYRGNTALGSAINISFNQATRTGTTPYFYLRHGDAIHFEGVPYGTIFYVTEYRNEVSRYYGQTAEAFRAGVRTSTSIYGQTGTNHLVVRGYMHQRVHNGEIVTGNWVAVTNDRGEIAPMGVIAENAPFIGLIALAAVSGALGFMKLRKRDEYEEDLV